MKVTVDINVLLDVLRAGFDHAGFNRLTDDLEAEAFLETTRKLADHSR